jgi:hypothetical protein
MSTVQFTPEFILAAVSMEMTKASTATNELERLANIGYIISQTGLDVAKEVKAHLTKAYELLDLLNLPEARMNQLGIAAAIGQQDIIIRKIELSL